MIILLTYSYIYNFIIISYPWYNCFPQSNSTLNCSFPIKWVKWFYFTWAFKSEYLGFIFAIICCGWPFSISFALFYLCFIFNWLKIMISLSKKWVGIVVYVWFNRLVHSLNNLILYLFTHFHLYHVYFTLQQQIF